MAKKVSTVSSQALTIGLLPEYRLKAAFVQRTLVPREAIDSRYFKVYCQTEADWKEWQNAVFLCNQGVKAHIRFLSFWNNSDGCYDRRLEEQCQKLYSMPFETVKSIWASRFDGFLTNCWHLIEMEQI